MNQYIKQYQKTHVETASQETILVMLHDGIIQFLNKAKVAMNNNDIQATHDNLMGAQNILYEFLNTIDPAPNPQLAEHLTNLYTYLIAQLVEANMKKTQEPIDNVLIFVKDLKATWEEAIARMNKKPVVENEDSEEDEDEDYDV